MLYKFLAQDLTSIYNPSCTWKVGEWKQHDGPLAMCSRGFHASEDPMNAFAHLEKLPQSASNAAWGWVDVGGQQLRYFTGEKECWERMCLVEVFPWTVEDSEAMLLEFLQFAAKYRPKSIDADGVAVMTKICDAFLSHWESGEFDRVPEPFSDLLGEVNPVIQRCPGVMYYLGNLMVDLLAFFPKSNLERLQIFAVRMSSLILSPVATVYFDGQIRPHIKTWMQNRFEAKLL